MAPSSSFALSLKPRVAYRVLNFCAFWKKQTTLSSLAYAGIPYQSLGASVGALAVMIECKRLPNARSPSAIAAIFSSTALSPSPLPPFSSCTYSLIAARSSAVNPLNFFAGLAAFFLGLMRTSSSRRGLKNCYFANSYA